MAKNEVPGGTGGKALVYLCRAPSSIQSKQQCLQLGPAESVGGKTMRNPVLVASLQSPTGWCVYK